MAGQKRIKKLNIPVLGMMLMPHVMFHGSNKEQ
jgi:hypothetical protein